MEYHRCNILLPEYLYNQLYSFTKHCVEESEIAKAIGENSIKLLNVCTNNAWSKTSQLRLNFCVENLYRSQTHFGNLNKQPTSQRRITVVSTLWINGETTLIRLWKWNKIQNRIFRVAQNWYNVAVQRWSNVKSTLHNVNATVFQRCAISFQRCYNITLHNYITLQY